MRHFILAETSFIGGVLLAPGSPVNDADLNGATPGSALIETDEQGAPLDPADIVRLRNLGVSLVPVQVAPVQPHAPNPTRPQSIPAHPIGAPFPPGTYVPADGVQSNAAAAAQAERIDQMADRAAERANAADAASRPEPPVRRGEDAGGLGAAGSGVGGTERPGSEPGPLDGSISDLTQHLEGVNDVAEVQRLIDAETGGKSRTGALAALEARRAQLAPEG